MTSSSDFLRQVRSAIAEVSPQQADQRRGAGAVLVDVREQVEWDAGYIPGANHVPRSYLEQQIETVVPDHGAEVILYCASGVRSAYGAATLGQLGYTNVASMAGGINAWRSLGLPTVMPTVLTAEQQQR